MTIFLILNSYELLSDLKDNIILENNKGEIGNYTFELWRDYGITEMILNEKGKFSCFWDNIGNALFRIGKRWNNEYKFQEIGNIKVNFEFSFETKGIGTSHIGIYGWTDDPLIEFYIVENWEGPLPSTTKFGTIFVDDGTYDMYSVILTQLEFKIIRQLWSIRKEKRNNGTVSANKHFEAWEKYGFNIGKLNEVSFCVEGYANSGNATITKNEIIIE